MTDYGRRPGDDAGSRTRVAVLTNVPAPYRLPAFRRLAETVDLTVIYSAESAPGAFSWNVRLDEEPYHVVQLATRPIGPADAPRYLSPRLFSTLWSAAPEVVISGGFSVATLHSLAYSRIKRVPLIVFSDGNSFSERAISRRQKLVRRVAARHSAAAIAASRSASRRFTELGFPPSRVHLAAHTTDMESYWAIARSRDRPKSDVTFLFAGRLVHDKGLDELIDAFAPVSASCKRCRLVIAGDGPLRSHLQTRVAREGIKNVELTGFVEHGDLPALYSRADVFVFPTFGDTFGMALLEAAAAGLALVCSPWAGAHEHLVSEGVSGATIDPGDRRTFEGVLRRLADDPGLCVRWGAAAYDLSRAHSIDAAAQGYMAAIAQAISRP